MSQRQPLLVRHAALVFSLRTFAAAMLAFSIALLLDMPRPYWAMASVYITSNVLTGATSSKAVYRILGTLVGAAGTIVLVPNLANAPELLVSHRSVGRHLSVSLADQRHPAQLRLHAGRLHRGAAGLPDRRDATIGLRHCGRARRGDHARNYLRERRCHDRAATQRRLCHFGTGGRLALQCAVNLVRMSSPVGAAIRSATTNAYALPSRLPKSTRSPAISTMRPRRQPISREAWDAYGNTCWRCFRCSDRSRIESSHSTRRERRRNVSPRSAQGPRDGSNRAVTIDRKPMRCVRRLMKSGRHWTRMQAGSTSRSPVSLPGCATLLMSYGIASFYAKRSPRTVAIRGGWKRARGGPRQQDQCEQYGRRSGRGRVGQGHWPSDSTEACGSRALTAAGANSRNLVG